MSTGAAGTSSEEGVGLCFAICEHLLQKKVCVWCVHTCVLGLGDNENFMSQYIMRVIITIIDIIMISF